jgi:hypothetical protein
MAFQPKARSVDKSMTQCNMSTERVYLSQVMIVSEYLTSNTVSTVTDLITDTGITNDQYKRMIKDGILTTSLNHEHNWVTLTSIINKNKDRQRFFRKKLDRSNKTIVVFHSKRNAKRTLSFLASKRPWGISEKEAEELLGRDCKRPLRELEKNNSIQSRLVNGERIYLNRIHKKAEIQMKERRINPRYKTDDEEDEDEDKVGYIKYEEFCRTFRESINEMDEKCPISSNRISTLLLMFNTNHSLRTMEAWIRFNSRIKEAVNLDWDMDHSTFCRDMGKIDEVYLKRLFHHIVMKLHDKGVITGKYLVVDATHIYAYCNTRKDTKKYGVEGASWGDHHGSFYGYKIHIMIDAESELPVAMILSTGEDHDSPHFIPLLDDHVKNNDLDEAEALLADAGYDTKSFRKKVLKKTGGIFLPACNPRNSKVLQRMKARVKKLFDTHGDKIHSVEDGFRYLGQTFLTRFGIELGDPGDNKLVELIAERLHRHLRAGVERVFSRLKALTSFERPKARYLETVKKTVWFCLIGQLVQAKIAVEKGLKGSMRKRTALV